MLFDPGDQIMTSAGAFRVMRRLGRGGMGAVYEAIDKELNSTVVLKLASEELAADPVARDRFKREARAIAQIKHRNVVRVTRSGHLHDDPRTPFYAMEHIAGTSIRSALMENKHGFRIDEAVFIALEMLNGLEEIHERGLLHRDIKTDNVLLHRDEKGQWTATIIDFGIAILLADGSSPKEVAYTPSYAAPEQLRAGELSRATDVFAAGLVLFEMLTGERPYKRFGIDDAGALARMNEPAPPLSNYGEYPPALARVIANALSLDPKDRPQTALGLIRELEKIQNAFVGIDLHEVATGRALKQIPVDATATASRTITEADLANPTDPDGEMPAWMGALRAQHKNAAVLGYAPTEMKPGEPVRYGGANDTEPSAPPMFTSPGARPINETVPMAGRPTPSPAVAEVAAPDVTAPPKKPLPPPRPTKELVYVDSSPLADMEKLREALAKNAPRTSNEAVIAPPRSHSSASKKRSSSSSRARRDGPSPIAKGIVFGAVLAIVVLVGILVVRARFSAESSNNAPAASARTP